MSLEKAAAEYLSREQGIDPAFIEKDWHAVRVLEALSHHSYEGATTIFTGGTSLSKGHDLLKRFSEDLDFRVRFEGDFSTNQLKKLKSAFRSSVIGALREIEDIAFDEDDIEKDGLGFKIQLTYPKVFESPEGIRAELQVEFSYTQPRLDPEQRSIASMITRFKGEADEASFLCLPPVEIAADKFSSLVWRVLKRNRDDEVDDPAMIRHLHDLCALKGRIQAEQGLFIVTALKSFTIDQERANRRVEMELEEASKKAADELKNDDLYRKEYQQFVDAMSYASDDEVISFETALSEFDELSRMFIK